jgi:5-bromo-4-chloroindolyl phosphate hydrolysis protein
MYNVKLTILTESGSEFDFTLADVNAKCPVDAIVTANKTFRERSIGKGEYQVIRAKLEQVKQEYIDEMNKTYSNSKWTGD